MRQALMSLFCLALLFPGGFFPVLLGQEKPYPPLSLDGMTPIGARTSTTEAWTQFGFNVINRTDRDRRARVLAFYSNVPDVQYGRDLLVPAMSTIKSWMLMGPAPQQSSMTGRDLNMLLYDISDGKEQLILPYTEERVRSRIVPYRKREQTTCIITDEETGGDLIFGKLPPRETRISEAINLVRCYRSTRELSGLVTNLATEDMPVVPEGYNGIDQVVIASSLVNEDPIRLQALRQWLEQGGKVWVMLDMTTQDAVAPLLGKSTNFQVINRVDLTSFQVRIRRLTTGKAQPPARQIDHPVSFVRVRLPEEEQAPLMLGDWPVLFTREVGQGRIIFTTLGPRGWHSPRPRGDESSPYPNFPFLPIPGEILETLTAEWMKEGEDRSIAAEPVQRLLQDQIGYSVLRRETVALVFAGFLAAVLALVILLRRTPYADMVGWIAPVVALGAGGLLFGLGEASRRAVPPTVASSQFVDAIPGVEEVAVRGHMAIFQPDSGGVLHEAKAGGLFYPDQTGLEGQTRRFIITDQNAWRWDNLSLPVGVRNASFQIGVDTPAALTAIARFGPQGLEGKLVHDPFKGVSDAILQLPGDRRMAVRFQGDGRFVSGPGDVLAPGQFLSSTLLSDRQQRRQKLFRDLIKPTPAAAPDPPPTLMAWADPLDLGFLANSRSDTSGLNQVGDAFLSFNLRLERPAPDTEVVIPGPFLAFRRLTSAGPGRLVRDSAQDAEFHLRFQLPPEVLPMKVERARLSGRIDAPGYSLTVDGRTAPEM
ncbi:MAG: hypothetical protein ACKO23_01060, partial [Gemmataceae bacterium]